MTYFKKGVYYAHTMKVKEVQYYFGFDGLSLYGLQYIKTKVREVCSDMRLRKL